MPRLLILILTAAPAAGCAKRLPPVVEASGTVRLNGKPLPNVAVTFVPMLDEFGSESDSTGTTDEQGRFRLTCRHNQQPGAVTGNHVVLVEEAGLPDKLRGVSDGRVIDQYRASLGNRPIPGKYASISASPLKVEVKAGQPTYDLNLER